MGFSGIALSDNQAGIEAQCFIAATHVKLLFFMEFNHFLNKYSIYFGISTYNCIFVYCLKTIY